MRPKGNAEPKRNVKHSFGLKLRSIRFECDSIRSNRVGRLSRAEIKEKLRIWLERTGQTAEREMAQYDQTISKVRRTQTGPGRAADFGGLHGRKAIVVLEQKVYGNALNKFDDAFPHFINMHRKRFFPLKLIITRGTQLGRFDWELMKRPACRLCSLTSSSVELKNLLSSSETALSNKVRSSNGFKVLSA